MRERERERVCVREKSKCVCVCVRERVEHRTALAYVMLAPFALAAGMVCVFV